MDQNLKDDLLGRRRAKELQQLAAERRRDTPLKEIRNMFGSGLSDEEFLLCYIMKGRQEIEAMRAAGAPKQYYNTSMPLLTLLRELGKTRNVRHIHVRRGSESLTLVNRPTRSQPGAR